MQNIKKYFMTLALLLTAVGGAWAEEVTNKIWKPGDTFNIGAAWLYDDDTSTETVFHSIDGDNTVPAINDWTYDSSWNQWKIPALIKVDKVDYSGDVSSLDFSIELALSAPEGKQSADVKPIGFKIISGAGTKESPYTFGLVYEEAAAEPTEWALTPDETGKTWTLDKMPASDVELQVEYYAESNLFLGKEALADKANIAVKNGETAVDFDPDGKSTTTVTEGNTVTAKFNGTKKVIGVKVEKKAEVDPAKAYQKWDADQKKLVATEIPTEVTTVANSNENVSWQAGTYVVEGNVTISGDITLSGDVNLIIKDGATLTANKINGGNKILSIYGQANQSGQLVVGNSGSDAISNITTLEVHSAKVTATSSASYCGGFFNLKTFNVYGGSVDAKCTGSNGFGTGLMENGSMNIYGGEVKAEGKGSGGIFYFHNDNKKPTVTVYGGKLWAGCTNKALYYINLTKDASYTSGKIETSADNSAWTEYTEAATPTTKYVRVGY